MYKVILLLCGLSLFPGLLIGQSEAAGNVPDEILTYTVRDTHRVNLLLDYVYVEEKSTRHHEVNAFVWEALAISREIEYGPGIGLSLIYLGAKYYQKSKIDSSLMFSLEAIEVLEGEGENRNLLTAYTNLSEVYIGADSFKKALEINLRSVAVIENDTPNYAHGRIYYYTAKSYNLLREFEDAVKFYLKARDNAEQFDYQVGVAVANSGLGRVYIDMGKFEEALPVLNSAYSYAETYDNLPNMAATDKRLGEAYLNLGENAQAATHFQRSITTSEHLGNANLLRDLYHLLGESYQKDGKFQEALANYKRGTELGDSLHELERKKTRDELLIKFETKELNQARAVAEANEKIAETKAAQRTLISIVVVSLSFIILLLLLYILKKLRDIRSQKAKLAEALALLEESSEYELAASRLVAMKSQMNPHFIFNTLNSIQDLVLQNDAEKSYDYIVLFAELVRKMLNYANEEYIKVSQEIKFLEVYLELEKLRFGDDFEFNIDLSAASNLNVPTLIIQPFVENALKHGLFHKKGHKQLHIHFEERGGLRCTITDNGVGREASHEIQSRRGHASFAMESIQKRMELLSKKHQIVFSVEIEDLYEAAQPTGTKIILDFPQVSTQPLL